MAEPEAYPCLWDDGSARMSGALAVLTCGERPIRNIAITAGVAFDFAPTSRVTMGLRRPASGLP
jgi:hypothetical protein